MPPAPRRRTSPIDGATATLLSCSAAGRYPPLGRDHAVDRCVFLLLTFFVFALILTVRMDATDIRLPEVRSGAESPTDPARGRRHERGRRDIHRRHRPRGASDAIGPETSGAIFGR